MRIPSFHRRRFINRGRQLRHVTARSCASFSRRARILGCVHGSRSHGHLTAPDCRAVWPWACALLLKCENRKVNSPPRKEVNGARRLRNSGSRPTALRRIRAKRVQWSNVKSGVYLYPCEKKKTRERETKMSTRHARARNSAVLKSAGPRHTRSSAHARASIPVTKR